MNDNTFSGSADNNAESNAAHETARIEQVPPVPQPQDQAVPPTQVFETVAQAQQSAPVRQPVEQSQHTLNQQNNPTATYPAQQAAPTANYPAQQSGATGGPAPYVKQGSTANQAAPTANYPAQQAAPYAHQTSTAHQTSAAHQTSTATGAAPTATAAPAPTKQRSLAMPIIATAALTAILASAATVGVSSLMDNNEPAAATATQSATADAAEKGSTGTVTPIESSTNQNPDWEAVTKAVSKTVVAIEVTSQDGGSEGSGVIIDTEGHIITNNHVVEGATNNEVTVTLDDGRIYTAEITGLDAATDLAVIKIKNPPADLSSASLADSDTVTVGSSVLAMGNPLGLAQTATTGIVSALDRPVSTAQTSDGTLVVTNAIQIDAAINPGNSGGPLFNSKGEVIGITSSIATMSSSSSSQSGSIGLGFAIPANLAQNISKQLIANGKAEHAFLGVSMSDGSGTVDGATRQGAVVQEITAGSPAEKAGLQKGDVIVSVDGSSVTGGESLTGFVREHQSGDTIKLGIIRDGKLIEVDTVLATKTETATTLPDEQSGSGSQGGSDQQGGSGSDQQGSDQYGQFDPANPPSLEDLQKLFEEYQQNNQ